MVSGTAGTVFLLDVDGSFLRSFLVPVTASGHGFRYCFSWFGSGQNKTDREM